MTKKLEVCLIGLLLTLPAGAATLQVGPDKPYQTPCAAIAKAADGDVIEIDAGLYQGDVCGWYKNGLTIRGVNGRAHIDAAGKNAKGKAIWVVSGNDTLIENIEFSGATVPDKNGAGIRAEGRNITIRNCYFHDNEDGILESSVVGSTVLIEFSEFARNGYGDGYSHNLYIGRCDRLIFRFNYSHDSKEGHLLKTRAGENYVLYNRLTQESGTGSYEADFPNGGTTYFIGNLVQQGPTAHNSTILTYLLEGTHPRNPGKDLYIINNTFVNQRGTGRFLSTGSAALPLVARNNVFYGNGTLTNQSAPVLEGNLIGDPLFADIDNFDYHLTPHSPAINAGVDPGQSAEGMLLAPLFQYAHPACGEERATVQTIDIGAYEWAGRRAAPCVFEKNGRMERAVEAPVVP